MNFAYLTSLNRSCNPVKQKEEVKVNVAKSKKVF